MARAIVLSKAGCEMTAEQREIDLSSPMIASTSPHLDSYQVV